MPTRNIVKEGDSCLRKVCRPVQDFNDRLHTLLDDMRETLEEAIGAGLAGPQVGVLRRVALVALDDDSYLEIINPEIIERTGTQTDVEGCLSIPDVWGMVERPMTVTVRAQDRFGKEFTYKAEGFTARAFCHEIDHLDGHLFTDFVTEYVNPEEMD